ncbi:hypothetical protein GCM10007418_10820 [Halopseudomonas salina]|uniref:Uncharacterized protein n=1 Tax=Halopseudomonas salina TaxID=1323744 RepID=A0ABQ1P8C9_9GAMM|nr:hypothetical protein GCM10007418_10820 [Halopseudomonas salina]
MQQVGQSLAQILLFTRFAPGQVVLNQGIDRQGITQSDIQKMYEGISTDWHYLAERTAGLNMDVLVATLAL